MCSGVPLSWSLPNVWMAREVNFVFLFGGRMLSWKHEGMRDWMEDALWTCECGIGVGLFSVESCLNANNSR